jgi:hypothetical protein
MKKIIVSLGDLYASKCVNCCSRAEWGLASVKGTQGCLEAVKNKNTYCLSCLKDVWDIIEHSGAEGVVEKTFGGEGGEWYCNISKKVIELEERLKKLEKMHVL